MCSPASEFVIHIRERSLEHGDPLTHCSHFIALAHPLCQSPCPLGQQNVPSWYGRFRDGQAPLLIARSVGVVVNFEASAVIIESRGDLTSLLLRVAVEQRVPIA